ncbi:transcription factor bHLH68-like [Canna indica]|uniref:Transcription factor bHLH68-like n=1 Tax=Canna indica TaxID=4628 RepID=A0AAQ3KI67_9LILI|nr:transcription factor bHLH68-like [Canna indica]
MYAGKKQIKMLGHKGKSKREPLLSSPNLIHRNKRRAILKVDLGLKESEKLNKSDNIIQTMNRGLFQNSQLVQQMMMGGGSSSSCWSINSLIRSPPEQTFPLLPPSSSSSSSSSSSPSVYNAHYPQPPSSMLPMATTPLHGSQDQLPESWSQLLLGGYNLGEEEKYGLTADHLHSRKMENWEEQLLFPSTAAMAEHIKQEYSAGSGYHHLHGHGSSSEEVQASKGPWNQILPPPPASSCITTRNMLDFTANHTHSPSAERLMHHQPPIADNNSPECNSSTATGLPFKKARIQASSAHSTFKVRKEKLGDRITALHQIVSPFGKTDTASVLLEAIGYIRFLQSQIEALSSPYLTAATPTINHHQQQQPAVTLSNESGSKKRGPPDHQEAGSNDEAAKKDLKSRGLCLVPVSFFLHVGGDNGADFWAAPALHGAF